MSNINFFRGPKKSYSLTEHGEGIYFAEDSGEILMNAKVYTGPKKKQCEQQWLDVKATIEEAFSEGGIVTLNNNVEISKALEVKPGVSAVLDLSGYTITNTNPEVSSAILVSNEASLIIKGNGTIEGGQGGACNMAVYIKGGHCVIEDGNFHVGPDKNDSWNSCVEINGGLLEVNGGTFSTDRPYNGKYFVLNKKDFSDSVIQVTGGTFINYNPANSQTEDPEQNFVANGYKAIQIDGTNNYKVIKA